MIARRGTPKTVVTDNGTNFVGAYNELVQLELDEQKIIGKTSSDHVKWNFNPPSGPHFGGSHEIMIKSAKKAINSILGNSEVTD